MKVIIPRGAKPIPLGLSEGYYTEGRQTYSLRVEWRLLYMPRGVKPIRIPWSRNSVKSGRVK